MGLGLSLTETGDIEAGFEAIREALSLIERAAFTGAGLFTHAIMAWLVARFGDLERAEEIVESSRSTWNERDVTLGFMIGARAVIAAMKGDEAEARSLADEARQAVNPDSLNPEFLGYATLLQAEMLLLLDDHESALKTTDGSLELLRAAGIRRFIPVVSLRRAMALRGLGRDSEAKEELHEALADTRDMGMKLTQMWILMEVVELDAELGNPPDTLQEAQSSITYIADHLGDEDLRQAFTTLPRVSAILEP